MVHVHLPLFLLEVAETPGGEEEAAVLVLLQGFVDVVQGGLPLASVQQVLGLTDVDVLLIDHVQTEIRPKLYLLYNSI